MLHKCILTTALVSLCFFINQSILTFFGFGGLTFMLLIPINEEGCRFVSILCGRPLNWLFTLLLASYEFILYMLMVNHEMNGYIPTYMILARVWCFLLHFILLSIQLYGYHFYKKKKKKLYLIAGYVFAVGLHYTWNAKIALFVVSLMK